MRCLSIKQPWAHLIVTGKKDVENRQWPTGQRGQFLIHAPKQADDYACGIFNVKPEQFPRGVILGAVTLVNCSRKITSEWHEPGAYGFYLTNPIPFSLLIPCRGQLGFFDPMLDEATWAKIKSQLALTEGQVIDG